MVEKIGKNYNGFNETREMKSAPGWGGGWLERMEGGEGGFCDAGGKRQRGRNRLARGECAARRRMQSTGSQREAV